MEELLWGGLCGGFCWGDYVKELLLGGLCEGAYVKNGLFPTGDFAGWIPPSGLY